MKSMIQISPSLPQIQRLTNKINSNDAGETNGEIIITGIILKILYNALSYAAHSPIIKFDSVNVQNASKVVTIENK